MRIPAAIRSLRHYEAVRGAALATLNRARQPLRGQRKLLADYLRRHPTAKLNIGCGNNLLHGWLNTEYSAPLRPGVLFLDARRPFPMPDASFDYVFSEHMIEHIPLSSGAHMLRECHRILKPGGRIRIATPRLEFLMELMTGPAAVHRAYADYHYADLEEEPSVRTPARILNDYHRRWGHEFVYDEPTLRLLLERAGFEKVKVMPLNVSDDTNLRGIENDGRMPEGMLALTTIVIEAEKRRRSSLRS